VTDEAGVVILNIVNSVSSVMAALTGVLLVMLAYAAYRKDRSQEPSSATTSTGGAQANTRIRRGLQSHRISRSSGGVKSLAVRCAFLVLSLLSLGEWVIVLIFFLPYVVAIHRVPTYGWDYSIGYLLGYHLGICGIILWVRTFGRLELRGWAICVTGVSCFAAPAFVIISGRHDLNVTSLTVVCFMAAIPYMFARIIADPQVASAFRNTVTTST
jgi:hypothetical protein